MIRKVAQRRTEVGGLREHIERLTAEITGLTGRETGREATRQRLDAATGHTRRAGRASGPSVARCAAREAGGQRPRWMAAWLSMAWRSPSTATTASLP